MQWSIGGKEHVQFWQLSPPRSKDSPTFKSMLPKRQCDEDSSGCDRSTFICFSPGHRQPTGLQSKRGTHEYRGASINQRAAGWPPAKNLPTIVTLYVNRNAAFRQSPRLGQSNSAIDFKTVFVLRHGCFVAEVFGAKTFIAMVLRIHSLAFAIRPPLKLTCR